MSKHSNNLIISKLALLQVQCILCITLASQCEEKLLCTGTFHFSNCVSRIWPGLGIDTRKSKEIIDIR